MPLSPAAVVGVILNLSIWFALHVFFAEVTANRAGPLVLWQPDIGTLDWRVLLLALLSGFAFASIALEHGSGAGNFGRLWRGAVVTGLGNQGAEICQKSIARFSTGGIDRLLRANSGHAQFSAKHRSRCWATIRTKTVLELNGGANQPLVPSKRDFYWKIGITLRDLDHCRGVHQAIGLAGVRPDSIRGYWLSLPLA